MFSRRAVHRFFALFAFCIASGFAHADHAGRWTVVELTPDSAGGGVARAVNNRGDVVGQTFTQGASGIASRAFLWHRGTRDAIPTPGSQSAAFAINEKGTIAGSVDGVAFMWTDGQPKSLLVAGEARAINDHDEITGNFWTGGTVGSGANVGFLFRDGAVFQLPNLSNGRGNNASDLDNAGIVVGNSVMTGSSDLHAVLWDNGVPRELGTLGGAQSFAARIDDHGDIVGEAQDATGNFVLVRWQARTGSIEKLLDRSSVAGINNRGDIIGNNLGTGAAFLLQEGTLTALLDLPAMKAAGWESFSPMGINDRGWIVGSAWKPGISTLGTALLLIPQ
jgi:uncharacterized membrane protein